ncbi:MAG: hypothetical protein HYX48_06375 [Chlamydiales bacterium]|nr:hypothetical protein [Chlamydiales bacterium]
MTSSGLRVVAKEALKAEVHQLGRVQRGYMRIKGVLRSCFNILTSLGEVVIIGSETPVRATAGKAFRSALTAIVRDIQVDGYNDFGRIQRSGSRTTISSGGGLVNFPLIRTLQSDARYGMGLKGGVVLLGPDVSGVLTSPKSFSFSEDLQISCAAPLFFDSEVVQRMALRLEDPRERRSIHALVSRHEYGRFHGVQALAFIKMNGNLIIQIAELATFYLAKAAGDSAAKNYEIDPATWTFAILTGLCAKGVSELVGAILTRALCYRADRMAVGVTRDPRSAVESLKILKAIPQERNWAERAILPLEILFTSNSKKLMLLPSMESRIKNLDPQGEYSEWEIPSLASLELAISDEEQLKVLVAMRQDLNQELAIALALKQNGSLLLKLGRSEAKRLLKALLLGYFVRSHFGLKAVAIASMATILTNLYPGLLEETSVVIPPAAQRALNLSPSIRSWGEELDVSRIAKEMGIKKQIQVRSRSQGGCGSQQTCEAESAYAARGTSMGPGRALVFSSSTPMPAFYKRFILRHELAHIKHGDTLMVDLAYLVTTLAANTLLDACGCAPTGVFEAAQQGMLIRFAAQGSQTLALTRIEARADRFALLSTPQEERAQLRVEGESSIKELQKMLLQVRNDPSAPLLMRLFRKIQISREGDLRFNFTHPSFSERRKMFAAL